MLRSLVFAFLLLDLTGTLWAQGTSGTVQGNITDKSGAILQGVKVTATETSTGLNFTSTSNRDGIYILAQLPPGEYQVTAEKGGFRSFQQQNLILRVNDQIALNISMDVGTVTSSVEVTGQAPLLQTDDAIVDKVVEERTIKQLPLNGRNAYSLVLLTPGTQQTSVSNGTSADAQPRLSGGRVRTGEFLLDGTSSTDPRRGDTVISPNLDAIQEFSVITNGVPAEFGRLVGGIVTATIKTGTNQFHGNLFEFYRGSGLAARNYFSTSVPHQVFNQFGGIIGGPIKRDRIFFFADYQGTRNRQQSIFNLTLPTQREAAGDFSQILGAPVGADALGRTIYQGEIFDPATTRTAPNGKLVRDPFPGNIIPAARFDSSGAKVAALYPAAQTAALTQNFHLLAPGGSTEDQFDIKVNGRLSEKDIAFIRFSYDRPVTVTARPYPSSGSGGSKGQVNSYYTTSMDWTRTISTSKINDLRFGSLRGELHRLLPETNFSSLGIPNLPQTNLPSFVIPGYDSLGDAAVFDPTEEEYQVEDIFTAIKGKHIVKAGLDFRRFHINDLQLSANGTFTLRANETGSPSSGATGNPVASLLLGAVDIYSNDPNRGRFYERSNYFGAFVQDEYKVTSKFTASLGLRYDVEQQPNEVDYNGSNFDLISGQVLTMRQLGRNRIQATQWTGFAPRIGFSWQPFGDSTVVRASYGIFYTPLSGRATSAYNRFPKSQPFTLQSNGIDPVVIVSQTPPSPINTNGFNETQQYDRVNDPYPYFQQWSLDLQRQLGGILLETAYIGSNGTHLLANINYNEIPISVVQAAGKGTQAMRPYPNFANIGPFCECQSSNYNAFEFSAERRYHSGLTFLASYTWSKFIDMNDDNFSGLLPQSSYNLKAERGLSLANIPVRFVFSSVYDLPFGSGRQFVNSGVLSRIIGGFQLGDILSLQSGQQVWIHSSNNTLQTFSGMMRPNLSGKFTLSGSAQKLTTWFNTAAFSAPAPLTPGNSPKTPNIQGPGWVNLDMNLHRDIHIPLNETTHLELRGECFNCANHAQFLPPNGLYGAGTFGQITSAQPARVIQIGGKFWF